MFILMQSLFYSKSFCGTFSLIELLQLSNPIVENIVCTFMIQLACLTLIEKNEVTGVRSV